MTATRVIMATMVLIAAARGETIVLKDGTFVEGKITVQTSASVRIDTRFGVRTYSRKEIDQIIESDAGGAAAEKSFAELSPAMKAVLNARAEYDLGQYEKAKERIEPFGQLSDQKAVRLRIDWLSIEIAERLGRWDEAKRLLKEKLDSGTPPEKTRAKAHLDLFEVNPEFDLRFVGKKHARQFLLDEELRNRAREAGSLRDEKVMRAALEEYCEQMLVEDKLSVKAFADKLDSERTYKAVRNATGAGDISSALPYIEDIKKAEASLLKAQAILGDYSSAFELDLARTELNHLIIIIERLLTEAYQQSPETMTPAYNPSNGMLTPDGRRQWQQRCDEFLNAIKPAARLLDYMAAKAERYPETLRDLRAILVDIGERVKENIRVVKRARDRTRI